MEAVPRLPMLGFDLLTATDKVTFGPKLKICIASIYNEDPEGFNNEIHALEGLRASAVFPSIDLQTCQTMKKYYCQLHFLKSRFPLEDFQPQASSLFFSWKDTYTKMHCSLPDINFEIMCILYNIGCIHMKLGAEDKRNTPEGMKMACSHFQCAAWAFQTIRENYGQHIGYILISAELVKGMQLVCLAQAQECILEKSLLDNRKATIIAKIAVQMGDFYRQAWQAFQSGDDCLVLDHIANHKYVAQYLQFKISYGRCIALLYQGQQAEEQQKMGERVAFYQASLDCLEEARKFVSKMSNSMQNLYSDTLAFTADVVEGKRKAATNENEFIYHEEVPPLASLQEIKGASLVKGIPFSIRDPEVSGNDIFGRLVPMEAHEASSLYSERKAQMLREIGARVEEKDLELCDFLNSMQLDIFSHLKNSKGLPQELVERAASMVARPNATQELVDAMAKLSDSYQEVESMLKEIQELLKQEEEAEQQYQSLMGKRPPSIIATDLARETAKYLEAHGKASESNLHLHKAMTSTVTNLKLLAQPISQLNLVIPSLQLPNPNVDEKMLEHMQSLMNKFDEMKNQRNSLWTQLRDDVHKDDITGIIVTKQPDQSLEAIFEQGLEKHSKTKALIEQNLLAQENICQAFVEAYGQFSPTRKYLQEFFHKRNFTLMALMSSHDSYDDLLSKANKGIEFYAKLETNVAKLLGRIKSACNVQQEERDEMLVKNGHPKQGIKNEPQPVVPITPSEPEIEINMKPSKPKLKDYLDSMKDKKEKKESLGPQSQYPVSSLHPSPKAMQQETPSAWNVQQVPNGETNFAPYNVTPTHNFTNGTVYNPATGYSAPENASQDLAGRLNNLKMNNYENSQHQNYYGNSAQASNAAFGMGYGQVPGSLAMPQQTVNYPEQYTPDASKGAPNYASYSNYPTNTTPTLTTDTTMSLNSYGHYEQSGGTAENYYHQYSAAPSGPISAATYQPYGNYSQPDAQPANAGFVAPQSYYPASNATAAVPQQNAINEQYANQQYPYSYPYSVPPKEDAYSSYGNYVAGSTVSGEYPSAATTSYQQPSFYASSVAATSNTYSAPTTLYHQPSAYAANAATSTTFTPTTPYSQHSQPPTMYAADPSTSTTYSAGMASSYSEYQANQANFPSANNQYTYQYPAASTPSYYASDAYSQYSQANYYPANYPSNGYEAGYGHQQPQQNLAYPYNNAAVTVDTAAAAAPAAVATATVTTTASDVTNTPKKESSIDLLAGLDFSINQPTLIPQKEEKKSVVEKSSSTTDAEILEIMPPKKLESETSKVNIPKKKEKSLRKVQKLSAELEQVPVFLLEVEKFAKYVESLTVKTLTGPSALETKWKELQECQEDGENSITVARNYPLKNRSPDILPYDATRVCLSAAKDDYINASHVPMDSCYMDFIITQLPLSSTVEDFWSMVWEQQVENIVCLLSDAEMTDCYWPSEVGRDINVNKRVILAHRSITEHWVERKLTISDEKESRLVNIYQFISWPGSLCPTNPTPYLDFLKVVLKSYEMQNCSGNPVLVHCWAGQGRSGICCALLVALMDLETALRPLPDIPTIAAKISAARRNVLRDREHLRFVYAALLCELQRLSKRFIKSDNSNEKADKDGTVSESKKEEVIDPLSALDPLWATRK